MYFKKLFLIGLSVAFLTGCSVPSILTSSTTTTTPSGQVVTQPTLNADIARAENVLKAAEDSHTKIGKLLLTAAQSGLLKGNNAAMAKKYYDQAGAVLDQAEAADKAVNASGVISLVATVQSLLGQAAATIGSK